MFENAAVAITELVFGFVERFLPRRALFRLRKYNGNIFKPVPATGLLNVVYSGFDGTYDVFSVRSRHDSWESLFCCSANCLFRFANISLIISSSAP